MDVVIVESPAKAATINKYLGKDYKVLASYGHVRDLPEKDGSVNPDDAFAMTWEVQAGANKQLNEIASYLKKAEHLFLATDPDREGEAISWHVLEVMRKKKLLDGKKISRIVFNAITRNAVLDAMNNPRELDKKLVDAYLARRALDYLVGFNLSPVLWRKLPGARSAGRVQSVALRLICVREIEIEQFKPREYWTIAADFQTEDKDTLPARLTHLDGKKLDKFSLADEASAKAAQKVIESGTFSVTKVESKPGQRKPTAPFTTSTLQQEASRKLGFNARRTMQVAQKLYEGISIDGEMTGLITYMRTDGQQIAPEAIDEIRTIIAEDFGDDYVPATARKYETSAANAQEAHEAIRPTSLARRPAHVSRLLKDDEARLYELIWKRSMASQMENARVQRTVIEISEPTGQTCLRASGTVITFAGFLKLYEEGLDDAKNSKSKGGKDEDADTQLPQVKQGADLTLDKVLPEQHFTEPPPRYSEATLVKKMEELGIGRPSTYASILSVLRDRDYVFMDKNRFKPQDKGRLVTSFLESFFNRYVEYDFTAALENDLDKVSNGELDYKDVLNQFWHDFHSSVTQTLEIRNTQILDTLNEVLGPYIFKDTGDGDPGACPKCETGRLSLKTGRYGAFVGCTEYPDCRFTRQFAQAAGEEGDIERELGTDPASGLVVHLKTGRFGPYIQLGETVDGEEKPKRCGLPKGKVAADIDLAYALQLLSLPREVGKHPETNQPITAELGRYGPYLRHGKESASLTNVDELFEIGVNRAVTVLAEKKTSRRPRASNILKELGTHPDDGKPVNVLDGRYGPYVKHGKINATIPNGEEPDEITLERGLTLIAERAAKGGRKKKPTRRKKSAK